MKYLGFQLKEHESRPNPVRIKELSEKSVPKNQA